MGCGGSRGCSTGECPGCCRSGINSIVELEIHYSVPIVTEASAYIFKNLYCITNLQSRELMLTGLEGNSYDGLDSMRLQIIGHLINTDIAPCGLLKDVDISYIEDGLYD